MHCYDFVMCGPCRYVLITCFKVREPLVAYFAARAYQEQSDWLNVWCQLQSLSLNRVSFQREMRESLGSLESLTQTTGPRSKPQSIEWTPLEDWESQRADALHRRLLLRRCLRGLVQWRQAAPKLRAEVEPQMAQVWGHRRR